MGALVVSVGVAHAASLAWLCDDAFISFRYAKNLVDGLGLVFNAGEKVEGYSNPLWTLLAAGALAVRVRAEWASIFFGILAYAGGLASLVWAHGAMRARLRVPPGIVTLPAAALVGALQPDWATFATSGLETSLFASLALGGMLVVLLGDAASVRRRAVLAGILLGLASITRHEGILLTALGGVCLLFQPKRRVGAIAVYAAAALCVWGPFTAWRCHYYGQFFPNTYYSKSGGSAYWSSGLEYVDLYLRRAWFVPLGGLVALFAGVSRWPSEPSAARWRAEIGRVAGGAAFVGAVYGAYVARVGGDFMYARMLVPVTPLFLLVLDVGLLRFAAAAVASDSRPAPLLPAAARAAAPVLAALAFLTPCPVARDLRSVVDERAFYDRAHVAQAIYGARALGPYLEGIPVTVAIYGSQARLAYLTPFPIAIEAQNGLTDAHIAHQPLAARGRVGHERPGTFDYLIGERKTDVTFSAYPAARLDLDSYIPRVSVRFGDIEGRMLHWDPAIVAQLRARGAVIDDFPTGLDGLISKLDTLPDDAVRRELARCDHFYFDGGVDPARRALMAQRLARGPLTK